jgi:glycine hydroxymethyltransferase
MDLSHGGHLTHGHPVTVLSRQFNFIRYRLKDIETGEIDFEELDALAEKHKPKIILAGYSSFPRELDYAKFAEIGRNHGALLMADIAHIAGLIAGGVLANPFDFGFHVMSSTTHKTLRGPRSGLIVSRGLASNPLVALEKSFENIPTLIDRTVFPGVQGGPHMNTILAKAVSFKEALKPEFSDYSKQVVNNSKRLASELMDRGLKLITNGTDNHLILIDIYKSFGFDGNEAEKALDKAGLTVNKNVIPDDPLPPFKPSGIRLGTPAITTRGFTEDQMPLLAEWITVALKNTNNDEELEKIKLQVAELAQNFPLPTENN